MEEIKLKPYSKYFIPVWTGLVKDKDAKHYKKMGKAVWLFLSLLHTANGMGYIQRLQFKTISQRTGISISTLKKFMSVLRLNGYVTTRSSGRYLTIQIQNWKHYKKKREEVDESIAKYLADLSRGTETDTSASPDKKHLQNKNKPIGNREKSLFSEEY